VRVFGHRWFLEIFNVEYLKKKTILERMVLCGLVEPGGIELWLESHINRVFDFFEMIKLPEKCPNFALADTGR